MELRHLITFKTIVDTGGFKKAADELGYAQSSITGHIKELEEELKKPLFDRLGRSISLTQTGKDFLPYALEIIKLYSKSQEVIHTSDGPSGQLTIGASESLMIYWLPTIIMDFMEKYPKVELTIKSVQDSKLSSQLKNNEIDVALLIDLPHWHSKELTIKKLQDTQLSFIQSTKKQNKHIPEKMLVTEYSCSWRPAVEEYIRNEEYGSLAKVELPSVEAIKKCVLCGLGKSILPHFVVKEEIDNGMLEESKVNGHYNLLNIYTVTHKDKWILTNLEAFLHHLDDEFK
ncbi:LysR family transcriptional regulator [Virgibacillus oceani]